MTVPRSQIIIDSEANTRKSMDKTRLSELAASIKQSGILTPVAVKPIIEGEETTGFKLVAGFRRLMAADSELEGDYPVPIHVVTEDELIVNIVENVQREDINPVDEAFGYLQLLQTGLTPKGIAQKVGVSQARVTLRLEVLDLPQKAIDFIRSGKLPIGTTKALKKIAESCPELAVDCAKVCASKPEYAAVLAKEPNRVVGYVADQNPGTYLWTGKRPGLESVLPLLEGEALAYITERYGLDKEDAVPVEERAFFDVKVPEGLTPAQGYQGDNTWVFHWTEHVDTIKELIGQRIREVMQQEAAQRKPVAAAEPEPVDPLDPNVSDEEIGRRQRAEAARAKEEREKREAEAKQRIDSRGANLSLGAQLKLTTATWTNTGDEQAILVQALLDELPLGRLGGAWQLVDENCQAEEKGKVAYAHATQGEREEYVKGWIRGGENPAAQLGRIVAVLAASALHDDRAVSESARPGRHFPYDELAAKVVELPHGIREMLNARPRQTSSSAFDQAAAAAAAESE